MFADHQGFVQQAYLELKAKGPLSTNLKHPSPAKLRNECERVIGKRFSKKDEEILSSFFGEQVDRAAYVTAINRFDIDLFRPLEKFMKGSSKNTDPKNIELLAWLIDYEPRPYRVDDLYGVSKTDSITIDVIDEDGQVKEHSQSIDGPIKSLWRPGSIVILAILCMVLIGAGYFFIGGSMEHRPQRCMYWTGDHYEPISCNEKPADSTLAVIALDSDKLVHFKRITRADTLTAGSIGKVWYININGNLEYYTSPGEPPSHPGRRLLPLTAHILDKYPRSPG
jgi:hypothetical protein